MEVEAAQVAAQTPLLSPVIIAALIVGVPLFGKLAIDFFKWWANRTVERVDKEKQETKGKVDDLTKKYDELDRKFERMTIEQNNHRADISRQLGEMNGKLETLDRRISESGKAREEHFDEALNRMAVELNRKLSQMLLTEIPELVRQTLREARGRTRKSR